MERGSKLREILLPVEFTEADTPINNMRFLDYCYRNKMPLVADFYLNIYLTQATVPRVVPNPSRVTVINVYKKERQRRKSNL